MKYLIIIISVLFSINIYSQRSSESHIKEIEKFQKKMNDEFKDVQHSPLSKEDIKTFKKLDFFAIDSSFRVVAQLKKHEDSKIFKMQTTTDRLPLYRIYASASFKINNEEYILHIYQNVNLIKTTEFENHLFLPFLDKTNGNTTYGGGRYIDLEIPKGDTMVIDFNKAYNPYCAYNEKYSCPIPPPINHFKIEINAGVKKYEDH